MGLLTVTSVQSDLITTRGIQQQQAQTHIRHLVRYVNTSLRLSSDIKPALCGTLVWTTEQDCIELTEVKNQHKACEFANCDP